jgi:phosphatidylserine/phosphatidylglycerophosphate/cardiolipin synthase-like enzyme
MEGKAPTALADAAARFVRECPVTQVASVVRELRCERDSRPRQIDLSQAGAIDFDRLVAALVAAWRDEPAIDAHTLAFALESALQVRTASHDVVELVWTGPPADSSTALNTTAILFGIVRRARRRLLLMSYSAFPIPGLVDDLRAAHERGVDVRLILESVAESSGRLTIDAALPFERLRGGATFYVWPHAARQPGAAMHAKVAAADGCRALVTSANLTERGIDSNLELGTYFEGERIPREIEERIDRLIELGVLVRVA